MICTHFDTSIRVFRADSAEEYLSNALCQVLAEQGTLAQFSCPGANTQNGVAERKHRHLLETARILMIVSSVPPHFWAEPISIATYLINIQPSSTPRVRSITCKWVYKVKTRSDGSHERYKDHLVARGFQQEQDHDYDETFAPVAHMTTVHTLLVVPSI
jgi:hypothetical protein